MILLGLALLFAIGCRTPTQAQRTVQANQPGQQLSTVSLESSRGRIVTVRIPYRFVVIDFGIDRLPAVGTTMAVFRNNVRVGTVRISGPSSGSMIVADVTEGDAQIGDEVRPSD